MNAVLLLSFQPTQSLLSQYETFLRLDYDVYVVVDDIDYAFDPGQLKVVRVDDDTCIKAGFRHLNPIIGKKSNCSAWDKAIYFLSHFGQRYSHVWLIEDDVFVPGGHALARMDEKYGDADIIGRENIINSSGEVSSWPHWKLVPRDLLPLPWARCLVCAVRLRRRVIRETSASIVTFNTSACARERERQHPSFIERGRIALRRLFGGSKHGPSPFIEFIFHTTALHKGFDVVEAEELSGLRWRKDWDAAEIADDCLYHPVKSQRDRQG